jgi:hypothetical protein
VGARKTSWDEDEEDEEGDDVDNYFDDDFM